MRRLQPGDPDLAQLAEELNQPEWEDFDNRFSADSLAAFLRDERRIYLVAYSEDRLAGALHAYLLLHPAGHSVMYIDEVDTAKPYRRRGVATSMMQEALRLADQAGATEAWLGTEDDNEPAKALYRKLFPIEEEIGSIFTYQPKERKERREELPAD